MIKIKLDSFLLINLFNILFYMEKYQILQVQWTELFNVKLCKTVQWWALNPQFSH